MNELLRMAVGRVLNEPEADEEFEDDITHGTLYAYNHKKCRCFDCKDTVRYYKAQRRRQHRLSNPIEPKVLQHGDNAMYSLHKCRCEICTNWNTDRMRRYRASKKA